MATMMHYHFQRNVKKRAKETAIVSLLFGAIFIPISYHLIGVASTPFERLFGQVFGWISLFGVAMMLLWSLLLATRKGGWLIEVTDSDVTWQAPPGIGEQGFRFALSEIERVVCVPSAEPSKDTYYLVTKTPEKIDLKPSHSGVSMHTFIQSLLDLGVPYEIKTKA